MPRHQQAGRQVGGWVGGWVGVLEGGDGETALAGSLWRCYPAQRRGVTSLSPTPSKSQNWTLILLLYTDSLNCISLLPIQHLSYLLKVMFLQMLNFG